MLDFSGNGGEYRAKRKGDTIEVRVTYRGPLRPNKYIKHGVHNCAQVLAVVEKDSIRLSMNGTADMTPGNWSNLKAAIDEAKSLL